MKSYFLSTIRCKGRASINQSIGSFFFILSITTFLIFTFVSCKHGTGGKKSLVGSIIEFGEYPQTILPESSTVTIDETPENAVTRKAGAFTYYKGSDEAWYCKIKEMQNLTEVFYTAMELMHARGKLMNAGLKLNQLDGEY